MQEIEKTRGMCPKCLKWVKSTVIENNNKIYLRKECELDGFTETFLSNSVKDFIDLRKFYFIAHKTVFPQTRYLFFLTPECNLSCPVCFLANGRKKTLNIDQDDIGKFLDKKKGEIIIFGAEPTCREDIFQIIKQIKERQYAVSLYTNGIKLRDLEYVRKIKESNVDKVYLQFDGFDDSIYEVFRDCKLASLKMKVLENLKKESIPVVLDVTVAKNLSSDSLKDVFFYALENKFIRTINLIAYVRSGGGSEYLKDNVTMPDDIVDEIASISKNRINQDNVRIFQKLLYVYMAFLKRRTCFYIKYFWIYRKSDNEYFTLDEIIDFNYLEKVLDTYIKIKSGQNNIFAFIYLMFRAPLILLNIKKPKEFVGMLKMGITHALNIRDYGRVNDNFLQLIFTTACDPHKADTKIVQRCHVGIVYKDKETGLKISDKNGMYLLEEEVKRKYPHE